MKIVLTIVLALVMLATLGVLFSGLLGLVRGGDPRRSNTLMRWRVLLQALAIGVFLLLVSYWRQA